ncbi:hypothetical protein M413DRAFT_349206 [Hebeloma cylindrosporum]|uniref:Uncharacterized protein n=1 Tax=Hebeloma cylindrosporum TaxID=76867 RepID=A0A0C3BTG7_HEBCY|nr:hypothetical protein M413DRAFT_349206 [Hebeloma cylindrosporum h7]
MIEERSCGSWLCFFLVNGRFCPGDPQGSDNATLNSGPSQSWTSAAHYLRIFALGPVFDDQCTAKLVVFSIPDIASLWLRGYALFFIIISAPSGPFPLPRVGGDLTNLDWRSFLSVCGISFILQPS